MNNEEPQELLDSFLQRWPLGRVRNLSLEEYVGVDNQDTFCYWVETKTQSLGNIKGQNSFIFGIYRRKEKTKTYSGKHGSDGEYAWETKFGTTRAQVFESVKNDLIGIIEYAESGNFSQIDDIKLHAFIKWKVAFLYSNERLIPIYAKAVLKAIARHFGLEVTKKTAISEIQELMIQHKSVNLTVHEYMRNLWDKFGGEESTEGVATHHEKDRENKPRPRKAAETLTIENQIRTTSQRSYSVEQIHKKLQLALQTKLVKQFGADCVLFEENNVDVKLIQPNRIVFYEVKSSSYATNCIKEGLGQLLYYSFCDKDPRKKLLVIAGQYPPTNEDLKFIEHLKTHLNFEFEYESISLVEV